MVHGIQVGEAINLMAHTGPVSKSPVLSLFSKSIESHLVSLLVSVGRPVIPSH